MKINRHDYYNYRLKKGRAKVQVEIAKNEYVDKLRRVLEGQRVLPAIDAYTKQPDPELIKKEMETLKHFRIHKPSHPDTSRRDWELSEISSGQRMGR